MHKKQGKCLIGFSFAAGTTLLELLIGIVIIFLLFGAVLGTLSQGFTAINMSRNKTHAQEANRIALEQIAALVRSSIDPEPIIVENNLFITRRNPTTGNTEDITVQKPANDSHLVTTGGLNKTIGYNVSSINFDITPAENDVGYVKIDNNTVADRSISAFSTSASPRITHVALNIVEANLAFSADFTTICNRRGGNCPSSVSQLTAIPDQNIAVLRIIPVIGNGIFSGQSLWGATTAGTSHTTTFDGAINLPPASGIYGGPPEPKNFTFVVKGKDMRKHQFINTNI